MGQGRALVLGASGFIGTRLVERLAKRGDEIIALDIAPPRQRLDGVAYHDADVREPLPAQYGDGVSVIYNLAAVHRTPGHPEQDYFATNIAGALNATALADACGVRTILFTSSISVYGPCEETVDESSPLRPVSSYGRSKRLAETVHGRWVAKGEGRRLVTVRPGVVFGPGERGNYTHLAAALRGGYFFYPGRKDTIKSGGYVDELLRTMEFTLARNEPEILYNFAYPTFSSTQDIVRTFAEITGRRADPPTAPLAPMLAAASLFELLARFGLKTPIHPARIMKLVQSTKIAPRWLQTHGYVFESDLKAALQAWAEETGGRFV